MAAVGAAEAALEINDAEGPQRRSRLLGLIRMFRNGLSRLGLFAHGGLFPFQTLAQPSGEAAIGLHRRLQRAGVRTVLHRAARSGRARITFVLTCLHTPPDIAVALQALAQCAVCRPGIQLAS
jgi:7-keto-8-aminopelargonate synthetase-like enzyme